MPSMYSGSGEIRLGFLPARYSNWPGVAVQSLPRRPFADTNLNRHQGLYITAGMRA